MSEEKLTRAAIVTGGSRGIGRAVCVALAKQGCNVVVNYCHGAEPAEQTAALCRAEGVQAVTMQADVSTAEGCKALFDAAAEAFGRVDVLVSNAGIAQQKLFTDITPEEWQRMLDVNLTGAFNLCQLVLPGMIRRKAGRILTVSSMWGQTGGSCEETPVGRLGSADEVAQLLVFLAGESAGYITGQVFGVNGGLVI